MKSVKKIPFTLMLVVLLAHAAQAATYYVSKSGNNSNAGTSTNAAFLTISKAASVMNAGDTCYILTGTYRETVTPAHSGTSSSPITFAAYPGAVPVVSGANLFTNTWSVYSNSIYKASTASSFVQLFVDGEMMNEARWPNATVNNLLYAPRSTPTSVTLTSLTDTNLPSGLSLVGAYMHFFASEDGNQGYAANTRQITSWNPSTQTFSWSGNVWRADQTGCLYYLYGALSLLDIPTEWYLNTGSGTLYLWTPDGASPANHVVEYKARTSAFTLDNLSYVTVNGIYVFGAGISMANTTSCVVNNCNLEYVQHNLTADWSVTSLPIADQVSGTGSVWENSTITYSSQDGIRCSGQNEVVSNCVIQQVDYYPGTYYACVTAYNGVSGTKVVNNTLWYSGRYCVGTTTPSMEIGYNDMGWGELLTSDGGGTYEYISNGAGTIIHNNWAHNCWAGVYLDQNTDNYFVYRNVCYSNYNGLCFNSTANNLIINNTSVSNTTDLLCNGSSNVNVAFINNIWRTTQATFNTNTTLTDNGWYPPLGANYVPLAGSGAIDGGEVYSPYTDGYVGAAPDIGAYEVGGTYWTPGANFTPQPFPNFNVVPSITVQPASQTNYINQTATFTVTVVSVPPLSYQWCAGPAGSGVFTNLIAGGQFSAVTNSTLTISNLTLSNSADFVVVMSNSIGSVTSAVATLTVANFAPSIATQPASMVNVVGQSATFTVAAAGLPPMYYQWQSGATGSGVFTNMIAGGQIPTVTNATLTINNLTTGNAADFEVVMTNAYGSITSAVATLSVSNSALVIATQPASQTNNIGQTATFSVIAAGIPTVYYQWQAGTTGSGGPYTNLIAGGQFSSVTNPTLAITNVALSNAADYVVIVNNSYGVITSAVATLTVLNSAPSITMQPVSQTNNLGQTATFTVTAAGSLPLYYQWQVESNGAYVNLNAGGQFSGVTNAALSINNLTLANGTNYDVVVTNSAGSITSAPATLTVIGTPPSITTQPANQTNYVGQMNTFTVSVSGSSPLYYQWQVETNGVYANLNAGGQFSAVTNATLTISSLTLVNATNYKVMVTNLYGSVTSAPATLTVFNGTVPSIAAQPANQTNYVAQTATFTVSASGTAPLSYQWQVESNGVYANLGAGGQFSGVTNTTLTIISLALTNATNYDVVVANASGSVTSSLAMLTVLTNLPYQIVILADNPVSYWPMQEITGPTIHDIVTTNAGPFNGTLQISTDGFASGAANGEGVNDGIVHETFTNSASTVASDGATYLFGGPGGLAGVSGDTAIYFTNLNGQLNNAQIAVGTGGTGAYEAQLDSSTFTVEAWIKFPTYPIGWTSNVFQVPLGLNAQGNSGNTDNGWWMGVKTDGSGSGAYGEMFFEAGTGTAYTSNGPSAQVFSGKWVYAVQEYNGTATVIYTNGTLMASNTQTYQPLSNSPSHEEPLIIGSENSYYFGGSTFSGNTRAEFWNGGISHLAYYNYALSAGRILTHYQVASTIVSPTPPTLSIQQSGTNVTVSWTSGFLQQATNLAGPWTDVLPTNETSPKVITVTNSKLFFRASSQP